MLCLCHILLLLLLHSPAKTIRRIIIFCNDIAPAAAFEVACSIIISQVRWNFLVTSRLFLRLRKKMDELWTSERCRCGFLRSWFFFKDACCIFSLFSFILCLCNWFSDFYFISSTRRENPQELASLGMRRFFLRCLMLEFCSILSGIGSSSLESLFLWDLEIKRGNSGEKGCSSGQKWSPGCLFSFWGMIAGISWYYFRGFSLGLPEKRSCTWSWMDTLRSMEILL